MEIRIYYEDTDCGGVVYYANYLRYLERARTEYFRSRGVEIDRLAQEGFLFMVSHVDISYRHPARYNDVLEIHTGVEVVKQASFSLTHRVNLAGMPARRPPVREAGSGRDRTVVNARVRMVCVGREGKPVKLPLEMAKALQ